jgi:CPA1 family monovalent cation:H+ antiporter
MHGGTGTPELVAAVAALLLIAAATLALTKRIRLPFTVALVLLGVGIAELAGHGPPALHALTAWELSPEVILFVFLPTLIFESAFNLDARQLRRNIAPVLTLAVPGLLLSTTLIGTLVWLATPFDFLPALLLGSILSATDPVAVIALFRQLGAPRRLTVLVEGESLFNDATAIVVSRIIVGVLAAGTVGAELVVEGLVGFLVVFFGGVLVGWAAAVLTGWVLGRVHDDPLIEITLTTVLAYFSFLLAEEAFHVSGVMAVVAAGLTLGGWGRSKISPAILGYLEHFWEYLVFAANALIFLMVGLRVDLAGFAGMLGPLAVVILAMLLSRALVVYGLVPINTRLGAEPISRGYQSVMVWGGLRGAIALALVLSLGDAPWADAFVTLVTGAVLFTLVVQGLTMEPLVKGLGLDRPPLADRFARAEGRRAAKQTSLDRIPELQRSGLFSARIAGRLRGELEAELAEVDVELDRLKAMELEAGDERRLLFLRGFQVEQRRYYALFAHGHISEAAYRDLSHSVGLQIEAMRHDGRLPAYTIRPPEDKTYRDDALRALEHAPGLSATAEAVRTRRAARDYEVAWGRHLASGRVLDDLDRLARAGSLADAVTEDVRVQYTAWHDGAKERLDVVAELFPEFVRTMQERLADRLVAHAEREALEAQVESGRIPAGVAGPELARLWRRIRQSTVGTTEALHADPEELLRTVPLFAPVPADQFAPLAELLDHQTIPAGTSIVRQGGKGDALYLIARGVVRVSRSEDHGEERDLATLFAGDFFGEMALLTGEPRTATCRAVTPCVVYRLKRSDFEQVRAAHPSIQEALAEVERERREQLAHG